MTAWLAVVTILTRSRRRLTRAEAKALARAECERLGWQCSETATVDWHWRAWLVRPDGRVLGSDTVIMVDAYDGSILASWIWPRGCDHRR
jgi:hypothetical protein